MNKARSRGNSVQTVVDFLQLETIGRDRLGELMVNDCIDWFDSEKKSRIDIIKKYGLDKRSAILLSAYSFKEYASDFEKFKEKFKNTSSSSLHVLSLSLLDYHMEKDKIYHRHALELLLFNPDLNSFSHHHLKIPTLFLIQILSTGKYKGELIATTVEKWQLFLFVQALVVFVKLFVINIVLSDDDNGDDDDHSDVSSSMMMFTIYSLLFGSLIILLLLMCLQKITGYDIDEDDLKNNSKKTQKRKQWNNCNIEARFWVDRRYIFGEYLITGLAILMCSLWLTAMVMMSQALPNNSSFSISTGLTYIIAIIILYSSKILLSFEPFNILSWYGFMYYGTCRLTNSLSKLLTSFIEWITFLFIMIIPYLLLFLIFTMLSLIKRDKKPLIVYKIIPTLIRQGIQFILFFLFFYFPLEFIEHFYLSKILNNMAIINLGKGQCLIHPNIDTFESLMVCTMLDDDDDDDDSGGLGSSSESFLMYQYSKELKKEINGIGNALMKEHIQFLFSLRHNITNNISSPPSSPSNFNKKIPSSIGNNGKNNEIDNSDDISFHGNYYKSISNEHIQILNKRDEKEKKLSGDVVLSSESTNPDVEVEVDVEGGAVTISEAVQLSSSTAI